MEKPKKVLIITYYWPPSAGSGVQRWLKFAKYLPDFGWEPVIFTPENPDFELKDEGLLKEVPKDLEVLHFPIWEPYGVFRFLKKGKTVKKEDPAKIIEKQHKSWLDQTAMWLRANALVPDPRVFWVKPSVNYLLEILHKNEIKAVITTGPPHSMHLIGRDLKRKTDIAWIADFRDPWSTWEFLDTLPMMASIRKRHEKLEKGVFREADGVVTISPTFREELKKIADRDIALITNGFDSADLPESFKKKKSEQEFFEIVYTGIIDSIRNPVPFLQALKNACKVKEKPVKLTFVGRVSQKVLDYVAKDHWLSKRVEFPGYVSHKEVFSFYEKADMLLLILTDTKNAKGNIPGKLFEYIATGRTIVALGDPEGDSSKIIAEAGAGKVFAHKAVDSITQFLEEQIDHQNEESEKRDISRFERKFLTQKLAQLLDEKTDTIS
ncbi:glycosyltransferase family 4 protein [Echinicola jeungdonensis]|uniref:Glycosyltransferase family 4 protein n=1 Tax=Echinicola jeungdonensis TaxID=709343 RepID=A0ABV5J2F7_9BACT|nr:glycosyltransferase family 4 protein [Echinicola jeungdonensis]MDN3667830.1 glycosyltransferase family 4 protein [Echinicola jeungdonensis]